jgi:hypothetical protein
MDDPALLSIVIGIGVIVLIVGISLAISGPGGSAAEDRLAELVGGRKVKKPKKEDLSSGILARPAAIDLGRPSFWTRMLPNAENLNMLYEQADVNFSFNRFMSVVAGLGAAGGAGRGDSLGLAAILLAHVPSSPADRPVCRVDARSG